MFCPLKITGTLSAFHLSNRLEAASRSLVLHPPRVLRLSCLGLATKTAPLYEKKLRKNAEVKESNKLSLKKIVWRSSG